MATSPTQRTLQRLRKLGYEPDVCERWLPALVQPARGQVPALFRLVKRRDLFGFADVAAVKAGEPILLVQATTGSNTGARVAKILAEPRARLCLTAGAQIEVWGWRKLKLRRGGKAIRWEPKIQAITLEDFGSPLAEHSPGG